MEAHQREQRSGQRCWVLHCPPLLQQQEQRQKHCSVLLLSAIEAEPLDEQRAQVQQQSRAQQQPQTQQQPKKKQQRKRK